jgi:hypothetical protein
MHLSFSLLVLLLAASATRAEETPKPAVSAQSPEVSRPLPVEYKLGPDSLHQEGVPGGYATVVVAGLSEIEQGGSFRLTSASPQCDSTL